LCQLAHLARLTLADKSARVRRLEPLPNRSGNLGAGAFGQRFEFVERFFAADPRIGTEFDPDKDSALVILVSNVVRFRQVITSNRRKSGIQVYQIPAIRGTAQFYLNSTEPGAKICSSSATKVWVGVTR
jgi:hypothetical protein